MLCKKLFFKTEEVDCSYFFAKLCPIFNISQPCYAIAFLSLKLDYICWIIYIYIYYIQYAIFPHKEHNRRQVPFETHGRRSNYDIRRRSIVSQQKEYVTIRENSADANVTSENLLKIGVTSFSAFLSEWVGKTKKA
jgi:hypothetical protein